MLDNMFKYLDLMSTSCSLVDTFSLLLFSFFLTGTHLFFLYKLLHYSYNFKKKLTNGKNKTSGTEKETHCHQSVEPDTSKLFLHYLPKTS